MSECREMNIESWVRNSLGVIRDGNSPTDNETSEGIFWGEEGGRGEGGVGRKKKERYF